MKSSHSLLFFSIQKKTYYLQISYQMFSYVFILFVLCGCSTKDDSLYCENEMNATVIKEINAYPAVVFQRACISEITKLHPEFLDKNWHFHLKMKHEEAGGTWPFDALSLFAVDDNQSRIEIRIPEQLSCAKVQFTNKKQVAEFLQLFFDAEKLAPFFDEPWIFSAKQYPMEITPIPQGFEIHRFVYILHKRNRILGGKSPSGLGELNEVVETISPEGKYQMQSKKIISKINIRFNEPYPLGFSITPKSKNR